MRYANKAGTRKLILVDKYVQLSKDKKLVTIYKECPGTCIQLHLVIMHLNNNKKIFLSKLIQFEVFFLKKSNDFEPVDDVTSHCCQRRDC